MPHVVVRSIDDGPRGDWIETVLHEPSHAHAEPYVRGEIDLDTAVRRTLESLQAPSPQG